MRNRFSRKGFSAVVLIIIIVAVILVLGGLFLVLGPMLLPNVLNTKNIAMEAARKAELARSQVQSTSETADVSAEQEKCEAEGEKYIGSDKTKKSFPFYSEETKGCIMIQLSNLENENYDYSIGHWGDGWKQDPGSLFYCSKFGINNFLLDKLTSVNIYEEPIEKWADDGAGGSPLNMLTIRFDSPVKETEEQCTIALKKKLKELKLTDSQLASIPLEGPYITAQTNTEKICDLFSVQDAARITGLPIIDSWSGGYNPTCLYSKTYSKEKILGHTISDFAIQHIKNLKLEDIRISNAKMKIDTHDEVQHGSFMVKSQYLDEESGYYNMSFYFVLNGDPYSVNTTDNKNGPKMEQALIDIAKELLKSDSGAVLKQNQPTAQGTTAPVKRVKRTN